MKVSELKRLLKKNGCVFYRHGGEHDVWKTASGDKIRIPRHDAAELPTGTAKQILKDAGIA